VVVKPGQSVEEAGVKKVLCIDMDGVLAPFESAFPHLPAETLRKY